MRPAGSFGFLLVCLFATIGSAQTITNSYPGIFVDLSTSGGIPITPISDDSVTTIVTTVGNGLFPAGSVSVGNNGLASAAAAAAGPFTNADIVGPTAVPSGLSAGAAGILCPFWDDLYPTTAVPPTGIYWQESGGVLYIMWKDENHFASAAAGEGITFEIQVFSAPAPGTPWIQFLYPDAVFGGTMAINDKAASATIGYVKAGNAIGLNAKWSFNTVSITNGTVLSIFKMPLTFTSPLGATSIQADIDNGPSSGSYFLCVALSAGAFPTGFFFGISPTYQDIVNEVQAGPPFVGSLDVTGHITIGPFSGLPSGFALWAVALGFDTSTLDVPTGFSRPQAYVIP